MVFELPPKLSFNNHVKTESRYGINNFFCVESEDLSAVRKWQNIKEIFSKFKTY